MTERLNLIEQLKKYDREYFNDDVTTLTDTEYDILKEQAKAQFPNDPYFQTIGAEIEKGKKVSLPYTLGSLDKVKSDTVEKWLKDKESIVLSHKLDGVSFMVTYENGKVIFAATRGNGQEGQDITDKIKLILPKIEWNYRVSLRGELLLTGNSYIQLSFKNRRNGVAGIISNDKVSLDALKKLYPVFYEVLDVEGDMPETENERLEFIEKELKLNTVEHELWEALDADTLTKTLIEDKLELDYDIDGLVLTKNESEREDVMIPENKVAFKVNTEAIRVEVKKVEWNLGRTGKVTPLVYIKPIELDGVTISKATGFNAKFIQDNQIQKGSIIGIIRANQVIPYITEVFSS